MVGLKQINTTHGRAVGDDVLLHVVRHATAGLRLADILFRYGSDEFVALLNHTSAESAQAIGEEIRGEIQKSRMTIFPNGAICLDVSVVAVSSPTDGDSLPALVKSAGGKRDNMVVSRDRSTVV